MTKFSFLDKIKGLLFGRGIIYVEGYTTDGYHAKMKQHYVGDPDTLDEEELFKNITNYVKLEFGKTLRKDTLKIIGRVES